MSKAVADGVSNELYARIGKHLVQIGRVLRLHSLGLGVVVDARIYVRHWAYIADAHRDHIPFEIYIPSRHPHVSLNMRMEVQSIESRYNRRPRVIASFKGPVR